MADRDPAPASTRLARAKINLCLHVVGRRSDGYHLLDSLVVFPEIGDVVEAAPGPGLSLSLSGPFAGDLDAGGDNLVIKAAAALEARLARSGRRPMGAALHLDKRLPVASGIGGGSADAAAALRLLDALWGAESGPEVLADLALSLGADVPACVRSAPVSMRGVGERLAAAPPMPAFWMVLANPGVAVSTPQVFAALAHADNSPPPPAPTRFESLDALVAWLAETRNDLEPAARRLRPAIGDARDALAAIEGCRLARMSGSGATCFGLFADEAEALAAADGLRAAHPAWWVAPAPVRAWTIGEAPPATP